MAHRMVYTRSETVTADAQWELDPIDLSHADELHLEVLLTGNAGALAGDTLNVRLQSRTNANKWTDRIAIRQLIGTMTSGEYTQSVNQKFGTFSDSEETDETSGSTGAARLTAGTVRNGPFPGVYRPAATGAGATNMPGAGWRVDLDITSASAPSFPVTISVYADTAD